MKQKSSLDIAKFLCALLVLLIHANPFESYSKLLTFGLRNVICVIAVPFFFCTSGYLLMEKLRSLDTGAQKKYIGKYVMRLVVIYLVWSAVYFPFVVIRWVREGFNGWMVLDYVWEFFFEGSFSTIWFLPALLSAAGIFWLLRQKLSSQTIFFIGCGIYVITLLLSSYYGITARVPGLAQMGELYYTRFDSIKNGVLFGLVFVYMGAMLREAAWFENISRKKALIGAVLCFGLLGVEALLTSKIIGNVKGVDTVVAILPLTVCLLAFTLSFEVQPSKVCLTLRKYSMLVFLCQRIPITVLDLFLNKTVLVTNSLVHCLNVAAATFLISYVLLQLSEKWQWLKKIY